jgi:hypothetical protein
VFTNTQRVYKTTAGGGRKALNLWKHSALEHGQKHAIALSAVPRREYGNHQ